jgi:hypothetical protein
MPPLLVRRTCADNIQEDFIIVRRALEKEHIDEIIRISESYQEGKALMATATYRTKLTSIQQRKPHTSTRTSPQHCPRLHRRQHQL